MSDIAVEQSKPARPPSLLSLSFGGFNSIAIVTSSISILRLLTAHSTITLHGIVADVIDWYKKFFHESFDVAIEWVNALHIHWLHLPHISDNVKDIALIALLISTILYRSFSIYFYPYFEESRAFSNRASSSTNLIIQILSTLLLPIKAVAAFIFMLFFALYHVALVRIKSRKHVIAELRIIYFTLFLQVLGAGFTLTSLLVLSAYS